MLRFKNNRINFQAALPFVRYYREEWNDGDDGYDWKNRYLSEKRHLSLQYINNVNQRVPIHDAIRHRMELTHKEISKAASEVTQLFSENNYRCNNNNYQEYLKQKGPLNNNTLDSKDARSAKFSPNNKFQDSSGKYMERRSEIESQIETNTDDILKSINEMECDESLEDMIKYINTADATLLTEELLSGSTLMEENIAKAVNKIRENRIDDYQSYAAIPEKERSLWSAWYLRHVKNSSPTDDEEAQLEDIKLFF